MMVFGDKIFGCVCLDLFILVGLSFTDLLRFYSPINNVRSFFFNLGLIKIDFLIVRLCNSI